MPSRRARLLITVLSLLILRLERQLLQLIHRVLLNPKDLVNPLADNPKARRLTHVLDARHKPCLLDVTVLQSEVVVVDGEDLILSAVDEEQARAIGLVEGPVLEEGELV